MALRLFNTLTRRKEEFQSIVEGKVGLYTCGPTVYDFAHIGNLRAFIFEDLLRRYLKYSGYQVKQVMNLTDVDDKTIRGSKEQGVSLAEYTQTYKEAFFEDLRNLNIEPAEVYPAATDHIQDMVDLILRLRDRGYTYEMDGATYFRISDFKEYGKLAHFKIDQLKVGARIDADSYEKEEARDFALWKAWDEEDGEVFWETELGKGRPGWHIECSAMSMKHLGEQFDIHTGGVDNIFPHHENEIAQSEGATGKPWVNYWLHCEHLLVEGKKMSKSEGNYYTLKDLSEKGYDRKAIRYLLLSTHYRQQLNFTLAGIDASRSALQRLYDFMENLKRVRKGGNHPEVAECVAETKKNFGQAMDDDLNISGGLAAIFDFVRKINILAAGGKIARGDAVEIVRTMENFDTVLGVLEYKQREIDEDVERMIQERHQARTSGDWKKADEIRDRLREMDIILEDSPEGTRWKIL
ncbi:MAG: cysteine--tRNA ligase [Gemmatimonadota bacterium]|nr:MAG: cysteine--tRNA ligase [Gemmatimonadota bacterium]